LIQALAMAQRRSQRCPDGRQTPTRCRSADGAVRCSARRCGRAPARPLRSGASGAGRARGTPACGEPSFEWSVRKLIDCRNLGFADVGQAVNYVGSHDVGGVGNERLYTYLDFNGVVLKRQRIQLAFVCLLTAVGIPMILAGDEFADEHDIDIFHGDRNGRTPDANKQLDPVNYVRLDRDPWRQELFAYVSRLVKLRSTSSALAVNDTEFIHCDFDDGKRILVWKRGGQGWTTRSSWWRTSRIGGLRTREAPWRSTSCQTGPRCRRGGGGGRSRGIGRAGGVGGARAGVSLGGKLYVLE
jgi:hypothetical protein